MDYKTTYLKTNLSETEELFPELNELKFSSAIRGQIVFDSTHYIEANKLEPVDYKVFSRLLKSMIETIAKQFQRKTSELFYITPDGHVWITSELTFIYVAFINPEALLYFNSLIGDVMTDGVAYSDSFAYALAANHLPNEALSELIKQRSENDNTENEQHTDTGSGV